MKQQEVTTLSKKQLNRTRNDLPQEFSIISKAETEGINDTPVVHMNEMLTTTEKKKFTLNDTKPEI